MADYILQTRQLTKIYGQSKAVNGINMRVKQGEIYGFIGQNGAGKTTALRMIMHLVFPTSGEIEIFGKGGAKHLATARKRIGCMVESPAFYPRLSARDNLEYYRIQRGITDKTAVETALEMVGIQDTGKKQYSQFSLGMKQRLGLALSVMGMPDMLILDEPINGLDPMGIVEFREILKKLRQEYGMTVIVSSHILAELAQVATHYGIIHQGNLIQQLSQQELEQQTKRSIRLKVSDAMAAAVVLQQDLQVENFEVLPDKEIVLYEFLDNPSQVAFRLSAAGIGVSSMTEQGSSLEDYFMTLVSAQNKGGIV